MDVLTKSRDNRNGQDGNINTTAPIEPGATVSLTNTTCVAEAKEVDQLAFTEVDLSNFNVICEIALTASVKNRKQAANILAFESQFSEKLKNFLTINKT